MKKLLVLLFSISLAFSTGVTNWILDNPDGFHAPLTTTLVPERGGAEPTFTRASVASFIDCDGYVVTVNSGEPRFVGAKRVVNEIDESEDFSGFHLVDVTITANNILAPDGTLTATHYIQDDGVPGAGVIVKTDSFESPVILSGYFKKAELNWCALYTRPTVGKTWFDLENGVVGTVSNEHSNATITDVGDGWYRCSVLVLTANITRQGVYLAENDNDIYITTPETGIYMWGMQLEKASTGQTLPSEYVSNGVLSSPYHGAMVDGVGYFDTDRDGADIKQEPTELVTNGGFDADNSWEIEGAWVIENGYAVGNGATAGSQYLGQDFGAVTGRFYILSYEVLENSLEGGTGLLLSGTGIFDTQSIAQTVGKHSITLEATREDEVEDLRFLVSLSNDSGTVKIDNVSITAVDDTEFLKGVLIEGEMANKCTYSESFNSGDWGNIDCTYNFVSVESPLGDTSVLVTATANGSVLFYNNKTFSFTSGDYYTNSIFAKAGNSNYISITFTATAFAGGYAIYNLANGSIDTETQGSATIEPLIDGWYRCSFTAQANDTQDGARIIINPSYSGAARYTSVSGNSVYVIGAQFEESPFATSYIKTVASAVTRNSDVLSYLSEGLIDVTKGSMSTEFTTEWTDEALPVSSARFFDAIRYWLIDGASRGELLNDGTTSSPPQIITGNTTLQKVGCSWGDSYKNTLLNGVAGEDDSFDGNVGFSSTFALGNRTAGDRALFGTLKNFKIWKRKLPNNLMIGETE